MSTTTVEVTAMCLTCGTTRVAKARSLGGYAQLYRDNLRCAGCGCATRHWETAPTDWYGRREDALREACAKTQHYLKLLEGRGDVDVRWSAAPWCLNDPTEFGLSLQWALANPEAPDQGCHCAERCLAGARPAGTVVSVSEGNRWLVELDERQPLDRLDGALEQLWRDLTCGTVRPGALGLAYSTI